MCGKARLHLVCLISMDNQLRRQIREAKTGDPGKSLKLAQTLERAQAFPNVDERPAYPLLIDWGLIQIKPINNSTIALIASSSQPDDMPKRRKKKIPIPWWERGKFNWDEIAPIFAENDSEHEFTSLDFLNSLPLGRPMPLLGQYFNKENAWVPYYYNQTTGSIVSTALMRALQHWSISLIARSSIIGKEDLTPTQFRQYVLRSLNQSIKEWVTEHPKEMLLAEQTWRLFEVRLAQNRLTQHLEELRTFERDVISAIQNWVDIL